MFVESEIKGVGGWVEGGMLLLHKRTKREEKHS
jgi:hypothetical protein